MSDKLKSPKGQWWIFLLAAIALITVFVLRGGDRGESLLVVAVILNVGMVALTLFVMPFGMEDDEEARDLRMYAKLFGIASILLSGVIISPKFIT